MDNKKKFIIVLVILFIFLGLTIFTFANPRGEELEGSGNNVSSNNGNVDNGGSQDGTGSSEQEKDNQDKETRPNKVTQVTPNKDEDNTEDDNSGVTPTVDDAYEKALEAVLAAESNIDNDSYNNAKDLTGKLESSDKKQDLENRLAEVKDGIDVKQLVENLKNQTNSATNKDELDKARDYREVEDVVKKVEDLSIQNLKDELNQELDKLAVLLDDTKAPNISGVENNAITNAEITLTVDDENAKATVNGKEVALSDLTFTEEGTYTVTVTDEAFNETTVTFTIDTTAPVVTLKNTRGEVKEPGFYTYDLYAYIEESNEYTALLNGKEYVSGTKIGARDNYVLEVTDVAGNKTTVEFGIDKDAPKVSGVKNGEYYNHSVAIIVTDKNLDTVLLDGKTYDGSEITEEGSHTIVATDKAGNKTTVTFTIDTTAPVVTLYTNKDKKAVEPGYYADDMYAVITESNEYTALLNGETYVSETVVSRGNYVLVVTDVAGNSVTVEFGVDKNPPAFYVNGEKIDKKETSERYYNTDVTITYSELNEKEVIFEKDGKASEFTNKMTLTEDGVYHVKATDKANNVTEFTIVVDKTLPAVKIGGTTGSKYWKQPYEFTVEVTEDNLDSVYFIWNSSSNDDNMKKALNSENVQKVDAKDITDNGDGTYTVRIQANVEGRHVFNIKVVDKAGNELMTRKGWYQIDGIKPNTTRVIMANENNAEPYVRTGERVWVYATFDEELKEIPTILIDGNKVELTEVNARYFDPANKIYQYTLAFTMPEVEDGTIPFLMYGYDKADNKTDDVTNVTEGTLLTVDNTAPTVEIGGTTGSKYWKQPYEFTVKVTEDNLDSVYFIWNSSSNDDNMKKALNSENVQKVDAKDITDNGDGTYTVRIQANVEGRHVFNIKVVDKAGNELMTRKGWYQIDNTAAEIVDFRVQKYTNKLSKSSNETYATVGDHIMVTIVTNEKLTKEPVLVIGGVEIGKTNYKEEQFNKYVRIEIELTEDMKLEEGAPIPVTIKGMTDRAGIVTDEITKTADAEGNYYVIFDGTPINAKSSIFQMWNDKKVVNGDVTYVTTGSRIAVKVEYEEKLAAAPSITIAGVKATVNDHSTTDGKNIVWAGYVDLPENINVKSGDAIPFQVIAKDLAGNETITTSFTSAQKLIYDNEAPSLIIDGKVYKPSTEGVIDAITPIKSDGKVDGSATFSGVDELSGYAGIWGHDAQYKPELQSSYRRGAGYTYDIKAEDKLGNTHTYRVRVILNDAGSIQNLQSDLVLPVPEDSIENNVDEALPTVAPVEENEVALEEENILANTNEFIAISGLDEGTASILAEDLIVDDSSAEFMDYNGFSFVGPLSYSLIATHRANI